MRSLKALAAGALLPWLAAGAVSAQTSGAVKITIDGERQATLGQSRATDDGRFHDLYLLRLEEGEKVSLDMVSTDFDPYLDIATADRGRKVLASDDDSGDEDLAAHLDFVAPSTGDYLVRAQSVSENVGRYALTVERRKAVIPPATPISVPSETEGTFSEGGPTDLDDHPLAAYRIRGKSGQRLLIMMKSSAIDSKLQFKRVGDSSFVLEDDDGAGELNSLIVTTLPADGDYTLLASSLTGEGDYTVSVRTWNPVAADSVQDLALGRPVQGELSFDDLTAASATGSGAKPKIGKMFAIRGEAGDSIAIEMSSSDFDTVIEAGASSPIGFAVAASDDDGALSDEEGSTDSRLVVRFEQAGVVQLRATSLNGFALGSFTLKAAKVAR